MAVLTAPISTSAYSARGTWRDLDWSMLLLVICIAVWGCLTVTSASLPSEDPGRGAPATRITRPAANASSSSTAATTRRERGPSDTVKQAGFIVVGLLLLIALACIDFQMLMHLQNWVYMLMLAGLVAVLVMGRVINGAKSWIPLGPFALQPAEFAKIGVLLSLAGFLCRRQEKIRDFSTVLLSLAFLIPPVALIMKQPDFGTTMAIMSIWFGMLFFAGARLRHLGLILLIGAVAFGAAWKLDKLRPHQKERLAVFLNTDNNLRGAGYQVNQSQIAIGSGGVTGQGWGQGIQNRAGYVPEKTTDFIFAVVGEELGFAGGAMLLFLYLCLLLRCAWIGMTSDNYFGVLIAGGYCFLLAFHTIVNLGMTMRVMPITGVPLPFFSYGGSSFMSFAMGIGLLQSIAVRRKRVISV